MCRKVFKSDINSLDALNLDPRKCFALLIFPRKRASALNKIFVSAVISFKSILVVCANCAVHATMISIMEACIRFMRGVKLTASCTTSG